MEGIGVRERDALRVCWELVLLIAALGKGVLYFGEVGGETIVIVRIEEIPTGNYLYLLLCMALLSFGRLDLSGRHWCLVLAQSRPQMGKERLPLWKWWVELRSPMP